MEGTEVNKSKSLGCHCLVSGLCLTLFETPQTIALLCPWSFPGSIPYPMQEWWPFYSQGIFPSQGGPRVSCWQTDSFPLSHRKARRAETGIT